MDNLDLVLIGKIQKELFRLDKFLFEMYEMCIFFFILHGWFDKMLGGLGCEVNQEKYWMILFSKLRAI